MTSSPLLSLFQSQGLPLETRADGVQLPAHFGDREREELAAAQGTLLVDLSPRGLLQLTGKDRAKFLHNFCTQEIKALTPGQSAEAFVTTIQGKVLAHVFVFVDENAIWLEASAEREAALEKHLNKYIITEDVQVTSRSAEFAILYLAGPTLKETLSKIGVSLPADPRVGSFAAATDAGEFLLHRVPWTSAEGWELLVPVSKVQVVWERLIASGATPIGWQTFSLLRIQAGTPWDGVDMTPEQLAPEAARTVRAISYRKGCYLGQEPIARIDSMGHVNQELRVLTFPVGTPVLAAATELLDAENKPIGHITSSAASTATQECSALGYVRRSHLAFGSQVSVKMDGKVLTGTVASVLPLK